MLFVIIPLSVVLLGLIVYFALSPRSSKGLRLAALGALGAVMLAIGVCAVVVFAGRSADAEPVMPDFFAVEAPPPAPQGNSMVLAFLVVFLLAFMGLVVYLAMRERKGPEKSG
jgi:hypothetical protein